MTEGANSEDRVHLHPVFSASLVPLGPRSSSAVRVASWNILADAYCATEDSTRWSFRAPLIEEVVREVDADLLCLQEVDQDLADLARRHGYDCCRRLRPAAKPDGCAFLWRAQRLRLKAEQVVDFDRQVGRDDRNFSSFRRHNIAHVGLFEDGETGQHLLVANVHFYWNPRHEEVKVVQCYNTLVTLQKVLDEWHTLSEGPAKPLVIFAGDTNSTPGSLAHTLLSSGGLRNRQAGDSGGLDGLDKALDRLEISDGRPDETDGEMGDEEVKGVVEDGNGAATGGAANEAGEAKPVGSRPKASPGSTSDAAPSNGEQKEAEKEQKQPTSSAVGECRVGGIAFHCDRSLNKLCRWLRVLGVDASLETAKEEMVRTSGKNPEPIFQKCIEERRVLITASRHLVTRRGCPEAYLVSPHLVSLESIFRSIFKKFRIPCMPECYLTICVKCNGRIVNIDPPAAAADDWPDDADDTAADEEAGDEMGQPAAESDAQAGAGVVEKHELEVVSTGPCGLVDPEHPEQGLTWNAHPHRLERRYWMRHLHIDDSPDGRRRAEAIRRAGLEDGKVLDGRPIFECDNPCCGQVYWWSMQTADGKEGHTSSVRAKTTANMLHNLAFGVEDLGNPSEDPQESESSGVHKPRRSKETTLEDEAAPVHDHPVDSEMQELLTRCVAEALTDIPYADMRELAHGALRHDLNLQLASSQEECTNVTSGFQGVLDYIFVSSGSSEPSSDTLDKSTTTVLSTRANALPCLYDLVCNFPDDWALPSRHWPSDHLLVCTDIEYASANAEERDRIEY
mmetsp:Transcript_8633/g.32491  ORF Transcript_8633/g.32491 Transcript_8633/m.32491 type:complete len:791 (-) Transcript_8633:686-3058(-)